MDKKRWIIVFLILFVILCASAIMVRSFEITGLSGLTSIGKEEVTQSFNDNSGKISTFKNIIIKANIVPDSYDIMLKNKDVEIISKSIYIKTREEETNINLNESMILGDFNGELIYDNSGFLLKGSAKSYTANSIKTNWASPKDLSITLDSNTGSLIVKNVLIDNLKSHVAGTVELSSKVTMNLERDYFEINNFLGDLEVKNVKNLLLNGQAEDISVQTDGFGLSAA